MEKRPYRLSFRNIKELRNISINFNDIKNVLNSEVVNEMTGRIVINSNPDLTYDVSDTEKKKKVNSFLSEQIIKIQKRKKAIFEAFIKDKDSFLENRNDNRQADYILSVLDFYNFFGRDNVIIRSNDKKFEEYYAETSEILSDRLYSIYEKRIKNFESGDNQAEYERKKRGFYSKIENQKKEIVQSYILTKIFKYIKENFEYERPYVEKNAEGNTEIKYRKEKFLAEIPILNSLDLNFSEKINNDSDETEQIELISRNVAKARLLFDKEKKTILIPKTFFGNENNIYIITETKTETSHKLEEEQENKEFIINEIYKKDIFKKLIFKKFTEIMEKNTVTTEIKGETIQCYAVDIDFYNINIQKIKFINVVKSVVFKDLIDELRPYVAGTYDENGNNVKKSIKLNDIEKISEIMSYKKEQIELLLSNDKNKNFRKIEEKFAELEKKYMKQTENKEIINKIKNDIEEGIKKEKQDYLQLIKETKERMNRSLDEFERKNKDFSFNFKIKNIRKKERKIFEKKEKIVAIFLEDIYNILNIDKKYNEKSVPLDRDFLFIRVFMNLSQKFNFIVPFIDEYDDKESDRFVTLAFFNNISNVNSCFDNIVYNVSGIHIMKDKYKIFRKNNMKKEMLFLGHGGKVEKKRVTYLEYLDFKYRQKYKINKKNPFEITPENKTDYGEMFPNIFKYHRILGENIKYLFININSRKELRINSLLFKNYRNFINNIIILDGIINFGNTILEDGYEKNQKKIVLKNFIVDQNTFDIYVDEKYIETLHYNLHINEETKKIETVEQKLKKILSRI